MNIGIGRLDDLLRRLFNIPAAAQIAPTIASEIFPQIDLTRPPWELAELAYLAGWRGFHGRCFEAGVALQQSFCQLQNAVGSSKVFVVDLIEFYPLAVTDSCYVDVIPGTLFAGAVATQTRLDTRGRDPVTLGGAGLFTSGTGLAVPAYGSRAVAPLAAEMQPVEALYVITPGYGLQIVSQVVAGPLGVNVRWWERTATPAELRVS